MVRSVNASKIEAQDENDENVTCELFHDSHMPEIQR